jgi:hypothetical protein
MNNQGAGAATAGCSEARKKPRALKKIPLQ